MGLFSKLTDKKAKTAKRLHVSRDQTTSAAAELLVA